MLLRFHFKFRSCSKDCFRFWVPFGLPFWFIFQKNTVSKMASKKDPQHENKSLSWLIDMSGGSQRGCLACAFLKQETTNRAHILGNATRHRVLCSKMLFELLSIAKCRKAALKTLLVMWHALGKGPLNLIICIIIYRENVKKYKELMRDSQSIAKINWNCYELPRTLPPSPACLLVGWLAAGWLTGWLAACWLAGR